MSRNVLLCEGSRDLNTVGVLRVLYLNPFEGQYFEKLKNFGFFPVGITTYDHAFDLSEINFPVRMGHTLNTFTRGVSGNFARLARRLRRLHDFRAYNYLIWKLDELTRDLDILHSADVWYPFTYQALKTKIPVVVTEWENIPFNYEWPPYGKIKEYAREHVSHFVAVTEGAKRALMVEGVDPSRISVVPAGIDCERFKPTGREKEIARQFKIPEDTVNILFAGRLSSEKGIFDLLRAFSRLRRTFRDVLLIFVGSGHPKVLREIARLEAELKIGDRVRLLGSIKYSLMPKVHNLADVFCLPSVPTMEWEEQFGYVLVEAMACGKPVVSTLTGSIPEVVTDGATGLLVPSGDVKALQEALGELFLDEKKRRRLGRNARRWVLQKFEANKTAKQLAEIYRNFI